MKGFSDRIFSIQRFLNVNIFLKFIYSKKYSYLNKLERFLLENNQVNWINDRCGTHNDNQGLHIICEGLRGCEHDMPVQIFSQDQRLYQDARHVIRPWFVGVAIDVQYDLTSFRMWPPTHLVRMSYCTASGRVKGNQWSYNTKDSL